MTTLPYPTLPLTLTRAENPTLFEVYLNINKDKALIDADLIFDINTFRDLINVVNINVIRKIKKE